ncbi:dipeptide ABC transporter ATP-binding protein [Aquibacillus sp. 3ASR75-11]|uniref:Dipeptide ABC transporter ATP-binding protein n=1 Tax=Terrihalobacillus insolitus TaxID=2950438 RepID=A0A9X4ANM0_9BACI|nr:dipeptide ABC transporter ATP-binding protein [Terrihalobacillus insolitus]MDC3413796.1 dipeptide ABC transporter ATP-binding protein [Terrihalobacillus insolitus]MDC3425964.1 dipeptide ABC transporter ATP-binding protein [Terrihalobacillus insolitus]
MSVKEKTQPLLEVNNLKMHFPINKGIFSKQVGAVKAVDGVSFTVNKGETLGIVGESGCGKSTTARVIIRLLEATGGSVKLEGHELTNLNPKKMRELRKDIQMVFQDPFASLNPRWTVQRTLMEPMKVYGIGNKSERKRKVGELLNQVGLDESYAKRHAHEFSGGQRQRIGIARALVLNPKLIIADEPVSALDISVQSQVINLMQDMQQEYDLTYLFITHDLSVVEHIADKIAVMYLGKIVELADKEKIFDNPLHPYTEALISAAPEVNALEKKERIVLGGDVPSPANPPNGCPFHTRCHKAMDICKQEVPEFKEISDGQLTACHLY